MPLNFRRKLLSYKYLTKKLYSGDKMTLKLFPQSDEVQYTQVKNLRYKKNVLSDF